MKSGERICSASCSPVLAPGLHGLGTAQTIVMASARKSSTPMTIVCREKNWRRSVKRNTCRQAANREMFGWLSMRYSGRAARSIK